MSVRIQSLFDTPVKARMSADDYIASPQSAHKSDLIEGVFVISFLSNAHMSLAGEVYVKGAPDIAIEIISPSSRQYDAFEKRINYARAGVQEYWLVDPIERSVAIYSLEQDQFIRSAQADDVLRSTVLPGYWLRLAWIFPPAGEARPGELDVARAQGLI